MTLSIIMDLPAPVSPVSTFSPSESSMSRCSISAILLMISLESILPPGRFYGYASFSRMSLNTFRSPMRIKLTFCSAFVTVSDVFSGRLIS